MRDKLKRLEEQSDFTGHFGSLGRAGKCGSGVLEWPSVCAARVVLPNRGRELMNRVANGVLVLVSVFAVGTRVMAQAPDNDNCDSPLIVGQVQTPFDSSGATTDGNDEPDQCSFFGYTHIESDVWFRYAAECTGFVSISLCGSEYDTKMAVYRGSDCPTAVADVCSDDDCGTSSRQSRVSLPVTLGEQLMIRAGGFEGAQGAGILNIFCGNDDVFTTCTEFAGDCTVANSSRGCDDLTCCQQVCAIDPFCCDVEWDATCVASAAGVCGDGFEACGAPIPLGDFNGDGQSTITDYGSFNSCLTDSSPGSLAPGCFVFDFDSDKAINVSDFAGFQSTFGAGDCTLASGTPGCGLRDCCQAICESDAFCCLTRWDQNCANATPTEFSCACTADAGDCGASNGSVGCNDSTCCQIVCTDDSFCCAVEWDITCVDSAEELCGG